MPFPTLYFFSLTLFYNIAKWFGIALFYIYLFFPKKKKSKANIVCKSWNWENLCSPIESVFSCVKISSKIQDSLPKHLIKKFKIWKFIKCFHISRLYFIHHLMIRDRNVQWVDNHSLKSLQQKLTEIYLSELGSQTFAYMLKWISRFCLQHHFSMLTSLHL